MKSKSQFIICVDMDDTIENLCPAWLNRLNSKHNLNVSPDDITCWKIDTFFPTLTKDQIIEPLFEEGFWYTVEPKLDAIEYLHKLYEDGFSIYLCTSAHYGTCKEKMEAIVNRYFSFIDWKHIITCSNKQLINCDILIDDGLHNLIGGSYAPILFSASHNRGIDSESIGIPRCYSWKEVYDLVYEYYNLSD